MGVPPGFPADLIANEVLYRGLRSKDQMQDKRRAFLLRPGENGLSVNYGCTSDDCENGLNPSWGVLSLVAHQVTDLNLRVVADAETHANIEGLPYPDDDFAGAMRLAGQLSALATTIREGKRPRPAP